MEELKNLFAESKGIKSFDAYLNELFYWSKQLEIEQWYEDFAVFCMENKLVTN